MNQWNGLWKTMTRSFVASFINALAFLCLSGAAQAQVNLQLISAGGNAPFGVFVGPNTLQVNGGGTIQVICDDYATETKFSTDTLKGNYAGYDFSSIVIYTPTIPNSAREFMWRMISEPAGIALLGTGLIVIGGIIRHRRSKSSPTV